MSAMNLTQWFVTGIDCQTASSLTEWTELIQQLRKLFKLNRTIAKFELYPDIFEHAPETQINEKCEIVHESEMKLFMNISVISC